jgi:chromosomal replication initiation ATPase DnaA
MDSNFICACCGEHTMFTEEKADAIIGVVCNYYGVVKERAFAKAKCLAHVRKDNFDDLAQLMSVYFIRKFTAAPLKIIADHIGSNHTNISRATRTEI